MIFESREDKGTWANCRYHKAVYRPLGRALSRLWCAGIQTFMAAGGHATLAIPSFGTPIWLLPFLIVNRCVLQTRQWTCFIPAVCSIHVCLMNRHTTALLASPVQDKTSPLKSACKLTCLFGLLTPMSDVRPRHPHIKGNEGVGELIPVLEKILTFGTKMMRHLPCITPWLIAVTIFLD